MGRNKIKIEKKATSQQFVTYSKRKAGIAKKARELAILCDTDVLLLTISPKGKPDLVLGPKSNFEDIIHKFANQSPGERHKRKRECLLALSKAFRSDKDHDVDVEQLMNLGIPETSPVVKAQQQFIKLTQEIEDAKSLLGPLIDIRKLFMITSIDLLISIERAIKELIHENRMKKKYMQMLTDFQSFPTKEVMESPVALNGGGISHSAMRPHSLNEISISNIMATSPTPINCPPNVDNMFPQLFEGNVQKLYQRDVAGKPVSVSATSNVVASIPEEGGNWDDLFYSDKDGMNLDFATQDVFSHEAGFTKWASKTDAPA